MNAFGSALNLVFMRGSGCFSSGSYSRSMNLRLHSHEFLFEVNESQTAFPWVPIPSQWNESQTAFPWVPIPSQWISGCIPMSSYLPANESQKAFHEFLFPAKFLESFGWYHPCPAHPTSGMPVGVQNLAFWRDFGVTPYQYTWIPLKSILGRFRCLLRDFCF